MFKFLRFVLGFAVFYIEGKNKERFLNLAAKFKINIWGLKKESENKFFAKINATDFKNLRPLIKKTKTKVKLVSKHGLPFVVNEYKKRPGLIIGPICFCLVIFFLSFFIWDINVSGNEKLTEEEIIESVEELGFYTGSLKKCFDTELLERKIIKKIPNLSWAAVNLKGSCAEIEVKEKIEVPELVIKKDPCNLIAKKPGKITRLEIHEGKEEVKPGDSVSKGGLLVNGFNEDILGNSRVSHAYGKVYAITKRLLKEKTNFCQTFFRDTKKIINRKNIKVFGIKIPLTLSTRPGENYKKEFFVNKIKVGKTNLPVILCTEKYTKQTKEKKIINKDEAKKKTEENLKRREEFEFKDIKILSKKIIEREENGVYCQDVEYTCEENIAEEAQIILKN